MRSAIPATPTPQSAIAQGETARRLNVCKRAFAPRATTCTDSRPPGGRSSGPSDAPEHRQQRGAERPGAPPAQGSSPDPVEQLVRRPRQLRELDLAPGPPSTSREPPQQCERDELGKEVVEL